METARSPRITLALRVVVFSFLSYAGLLVFQTAIYVVGDRLLGSALGVFVAAVVANLITLRIYERGRLTDIGVQWNASSRHNLLVGMIGGMCAASLVLAPPLILGAADLQPDPEFPADMLAFTFVTVILLFGAAGEEMMFRGYGFQVLLAGIGPLATILPISVVFAALHWNNDYATPLALANTAGWGVILGVAFLRSRDLWLPIGLHFGWNWMLPVFGVRVSGFTMNTTGYVMRWNIADVWSGGAYGPEGGVFTSLVLLVLGLFLWKAPIRQQTAILLRAHKEG